MSFIHNASVLALVSILLIVIGCSSINSEHLLTFPTPLEDLNRLQPRCDPEQEVFHDAKKQFRRCLSDVKIESFMNDNNSSISRMTMNEKSSICNADAVYRMFEKCWKPIIKGINVCIPNRGTTVAKIYNAILDVSCKSFSDLMALSEPGKPKLCQPDPEYNYQTDQQCHNSEDFYSSDLCKSFLSQKKCEESRISNCKNELHKNLLLQQLGTVENELGCTINNGCGYIIFRYSLLLVVPLFSLVYLF